MSDAVEELTELLFSSRFMTLATADADGSPWASPVEFACDERLRFHWTSHLEARHSRNLRENPRAALSIYDSTQPAGLRAEVQGLYAEGPVEELGGADAAAMGPSLSRWIAWRDRTRITSSPRSDPQRMPDSPWRTYRLTPAGLYALDPAGHPDIPGVRIWRMPLDLSESFSRAYRARLG